MLRRQMLLGMTTMLGAGLAAACGAQAGAGAGAGASANVGAGAGAGKTTQAAPPKTLGTTETTLVWQTELPKDVMQGIDSFLAPWYEKYPKIKLEPYEAGGGDSQKVEKLLALATAGTPADVIGKVTFIQPLARPGAVRPLEPFIQRDRYDISGYNQGWLKTFGTFDGKLYSLPWGLGGNSAGFIVSPDALSEVGLKLPSQDWKNPWTWDQYRDYARRLTKKQGETLIRAGADELGNRNYTIPMEYGGLWLAEDGKTVVCDSPEMIEAYSKALEMVLKDGTTTASPGVSFPGGNNGRFANGQSAMSFVGGWQMVFFTHPDQYKVPYTFVTYPKAKFSTPDLDTIQLALGSNNKSPEESWAFMKWLLDGGKYANLVFRMPTLEKDASNWAKEAFKDVPPSAHVEVLTNSLKVSRPQDPVRAHPKVAIIEKEVTNPLMDSLWSGKIGVKDGLTDAKRQIQGIINS